MKSLLPFQFVVKINRCSFSLLASDSKFSTRSNTTNLNITTKSNKRVLKQTWRSNKQGSQINKEVKETSFCLVDIKKIKKLLNGDLKWMIKNKKKKQQIAWVQIKNNFVLHSRDFKKRILERHRIRTIFKPIIKLNMVLASGKDAVPASKRRGVVYEFHVGTVNTDTLERWNFFFLRMEVFLRVTCFVYCGKARTISTHESQQTKHNEAKRNEAWVLDWKNTTGRPYLGMFLKTQKKQL